VTTYRKKLDFSTWSLGRVNQWYNDNLFNGPLSSTTQVS